MDAGVELPGAMSSVQRGEAEGWGRQRSVAVFVDIRQECPEGGRHGQEGHDKEGNCRKSSKLNILGSNGGALERGEDLRRYDHNVDSPIVQLTQFLVLNSCVLTMSLRL